MVGIRLGVGRALVGVIIGDFFAGNSGIGYEITSFARKLDTSAVMASVVVVVVIGVVLNTLVRKLKNLADSWRTEID
jgi:ABC-type nitrate/sulfonate/bicarbonate transport system permease component